MRDVIGRSLLEVCVSGWTLGISLSLSVSPMCEFASRTSMLKECLNEVFAGKLENFVTHHMRVFICR